jgi:hypothetical protein
MAKFKIKYRGDLALDRDAPLYVLNPQFGWVIVTDSRAIVADRARRMSEMARLIYGTTH